MIRLKSFPNTEACNLFEAEYKESVVKKCGNHKGWILANLSLIQLIGKKRTLGPMFTQWIFGEWRLTLKVDTFLIFNCLEDVPMCYPSSTCGILYWYLIGFSRVMRLKHGVANNFRELAGIGEQNAMSKRFLPPLSYLRTI